MSRPRFRFAWQVLALQTVVVTLVVAVGFALFSWLLQRELTTQYGQRARAIALAVAADPIIVGAVGSYDPLADRYDPEQVVQDRAERIRRSTGVLFVVVTDRNGIRLSHPKTAEIGQRVSTDPSDALAGREVVTVERGTLGASARAKVPVRDAAGQVVGIVSVGFDVNDISAHWHDIVNVAGPFAVGALLLGVAGSALLTRRLRRLTLGLEPHELAELVQEREAVLHGIGEGVIAVDAANRVSVCNDETARLLGSDVTVGTAVTDLDLPPAIRLVLSDKGDADNLITVTGDRVLIANRRQVRHAGRDLGRVITLRDRTDLEFLTRELDAVRALTDGLRAQRHEFSNRLHTIAGLLETGHHTEAVEYLHTLSAPSAVAIDTDTDAIRDPYLRAFLAAKNAVAAEKSVRLDLGEESWLPSRVTAPVEVTTVVGNLLDNAFEAARLSAVRPAWVEIVLAAEGNTLHLSVADSGDGVAQPLHERIFAQGVSTRTGDNRGLGLALARQAARRLGGDVWLAQPGGPAGRTGAPSGPGAVFAARLPSVLTSIVETQS
jgi:two-component system CitB family sensor kinase